MAIENFDQQGPLGILQRSSHKFYLGGSRAMEIRELQIAANRTQGLGLNGLDILLKMSQPCVVTTPETDYDFYATYSLDLLAELTSNGFDHTVSSIGGFLNGHNDYMDNEAVAILEKDNVQVVLRKDALFYKRVFDSIPVEFYAKYLWKSSPHCAVDPTQIQPIFNALFAAAHAMEDTHVTD